MTTEWFERLDAEFQQAKEELFDLDRDAKKYVDPSTMYLPEAVNFLKKYLRVLGRFEGLSCAREIAFRAGHGQE